MVVVVVRINVRPELVTDLSYSLVFGTGYYFVAVVLNLTPCELFFSFLSQILSTESSLHLFTVLGPGGRPDSLLEVYLMKQLSWM